MNKCFFIAALLFLAFSAFPSSAQSVLPQTTADPSETMIREIPEPESAIGGRPHGYNCWDRSGDQKSQPAFAEIAASEIPQEFDAIVDLLDCRFGSKKPEAISLIESSSDGKAVLKLVLDPKTTEYRKARIELVLGDKIEGHILNIADSATCNGFGGDGATQSRDSEAQIVNADFSIFGDDMGPDGDKKVLASEKSFARPDSSVSFTLSNNFLSWQTSDGMTGSVDSPFLFSLDGQEDKEGPVNYDIFIGLNRVVGGDYRSGTGVKKALIKLFH